MHDPDEPDTDFAAGAVDGDSACRARLDALGLHTHDDLSRRIEPLVRPATRIELSPPTPPPQDADLVSHFGGLPYCEAGERWPRRSNGKPLHFVFQIFNQANLEIPDAIRLIQFYYDLDALSFDTEDEGWQVRIYKTLRIDNRVCAEPPPLLDITPYCPIGRASTYSTRPPATCLVFLIPTRPGTVINRRPRHGSATRNSAVS